MEGCELMVRKGKRERVVRVEVAGGLSGGIKATKKKRTDQGEQRGIVENGNGSETILRRKEEE